MSTAAQTDKNIEKKKHRSKDKAKGKKKANVLSNTYIEDSDDEQVHQLAALVPPGSVLLTSVVDAEEVDYDRLKDDDDLELWIVRVPDGVKPKHLAGARISVPSASSSSAHVGTLARKTATYDIWSVHDEASGQNTVIGGDEILGLSCLVPRKKKGGKLFSAPKPFAHHLVLSVQPVLPTPPPSSPDFPNADTYKSPARYCHPKHLLKHRFLPTGTVHESPAGDVDADMDVDQAAGASPQKVIASTVGKGSPKKRRKADDGAKKPKRSKTVS